MSSLRGTGHRWEEEPPPQSQEEPCLPGHLCVSAVFGEGDGKVAPRKLGFRGEEGSQEDGRKAFLAEAKAERQGFHGAFQEVHP